MLISADDAHSGRSEYLLEIEDLEAGYGKITVLHGVKMHIRAGEVVCLLGPNGAGKTTLLSAISGLLSWRGHAHFDARSLAGVSPRMAASLGLVHVIEGHRVFAQLTVHENLELASYMVSREERKRRIDEALSFFPEIAAKRADKGSLLSGGQQQMRAVAQGLVRQPRLLMLDEPSAGLSPVLVDRVLDVVAQLRRKGTSVLLVEQLVEKALAASDRVYALSQGKIVLEASSSEERLPERLEHAYFGKH